MLFNSFSSFITDAITLDKDNRYRILSIKNNATNQCEVLCDLISENKKVSFNLEDIIKSSKLKYFSNNDIITLSGLYEKANIQAKQSFSRFKFLTILTQLFVLAFLASNIAASKVIQFMGVTFSGGMITFPMLYVLNDVVTEVYGFKASRKIIWQALFSNFCLFTLLYLVVFLPSYGDNGFNEVFLLGPRIFLASTLSYLLGEFFNSFILSNLKIKFKGSYFTLRALLSTFCGAVIDTSIFFFIVFANQVTSSDMLYSISILALIKVCYAFLLLPITVSLVAFLKKEENIDIFEKPSFSSFNPFN